MPAPTLEDVREQLFDTLKQLKDKENPMSIERAKAISEVAQTIINSAKVEVDYLNVTDQNGARLPVIKQAEEKQEGLPAGVTGIHTHRLK